MKGGERERERERGREREAYLDVSDGVGSQFNNSKVSFSNDTLKLIEPNVGILLAAIDTSGRHVVCEGRERER